MPGGATPRNPPLRSAPRLRYLAVVSRGRRGLRPLAGRTMAGSGPALFAVAAQCPPWAHPDPRGPRDCGSAALFAVSFYACRVARGDATRRRRGILKPACTALPLRRYPSAGRAMAAARHCSLHRRAQTVAVLWPCSIDPSAKLSYSERCAVSSCIPSWPPDITSRDRTGRPLGVLWPAHAGSGRSWDIRASHQTFPCPHPEPTHT